MAGQILAAGVLGVAGWGIWRRSLVVATRADSLPLPLFEPGPDGNPQPSLEIRSRQWVVAQATPAFVAGGKLANLAELSTFFEKTKWVEGGSEVPAAYENDVANLAGAEWTYTRLMQATSLNMMALINDAQARTAVPPIPLNEIGTVLSFFNLQTNEPLIPIKQEIKTALEKVENYIRQKVPLPNETAYPPKPSSS